MNNKCVGKFENNVYKWLGLDKYEKFIYGFRRSHGHIEIIAQSIFGGTSIVVHRSICDSPFVLLDSTLAVKQSVGVMCYNYEIGGRCWLEFLLFSIVNKAFETYTCKLQNGWDTGDCSLLHSGSFGWMVCAFEVAFNCVVLRHVKFEESTKTYSMTVLTRCPTYKCLTVAHENIMFL